MVPYKPKAPDEVQRFFEHEAGFEPSEYIVPSQLGLPVATGLTGKDLEDAMERLFGDDSLDPERDRALIADVLRT